MRELLAAYIDSQAEWREAKAEEYPDDDRNARSAAALYDLATYVRELPDSDPRLRRLDAIDDFVSPGTGALSPGEEASRLMSRYYFHHAEVAYDWDAFLDTFVAAAEQEARAWRNEERRRVVRPVDS